MKKLATVVAITFLSGCAAMSGSKDEVKDLPTLVKDASASIKKAGSVGGEWRDTQKLLKGAKEAAKAGDAEKAISLAKKAQMQGQLGYEQALGQKDAGPWLF